MISGSFRKWRVVLPVLALAGPAIAQPVTKVVVVETKTVDAPSTITLVGSLDPLRATRVGAEVAGLVREMPVRQGDEVSEGQVLCRLNDDTLRLQLAEAGARLNALRSRHEELVAGTRKEELRRLKALLDEADADLVRWNAELERVERLYSDSSSNAKELYDTRAEYQKALRRKIAAEAAYQLGIEGPRAEAVAQAAYDVAAQKAVVDRIESDLAKMEIKSPYAGYVTALSTEQGEWLSEGATVVELIDLSTVLARVPAPEFALPYLAVGAPARVKIDAVGRSFAGEVRHVIRMADATARTFPIDVAVENESGRLAAGMFARVTVPGGESGLFTAVPKDAVVYRAGETFVAVVMPGKDGRMNGMLQPVSIGIDVDDWITITSDNLKPGTQVITRGNERMFPFPSPVIIVDENGLPVETASAASPGGGPRNPEPGGHGGH